MFCLVLILGLINSLITTTRTTRTTRTTTKTTGHNTPGPRVLALVLLVPVPVLGLVVLALPLAFRKLEIKCGNASCLHLILIR